MYRFSVSEEQLRQQYIKSNIVILPSGFTLHAACLNKSKSEDMFAVLSVSQK